MVFSNKRFIIDKIILGLDPEDIAITFKSDLNTLNLILYMYWSNRAYGRCYLSFIFPPGIGYLLDSEKLSSVDLKLVMILNLIWIRINSFLTNKEWLEVNLE